MSIEPIIASKARYQDSDLTPKDGMRNFFSDGSSDSSEKFNSYWDNATGISDSQSEESETEGVQDSGDSIPSQADSDNVLNFSRTPGFSGGSFSFSPMAFGREQLSNMVEFGRMDVGQDRSQNLVAMKAEVVDSAPVNDDRNGEGRIHEDIEGQDLNEGELGDDEDSTSKNKVRNLIPEAGLTVGSLLTQSGRTGSSVNATPVEKATNNELILSQTREMSEVKAVTAPVPESVGVNKSVNAEVVQPANLKAQPLATQSQDTLSVASIPSTLVTPTNTQLIATQSQQSSESLNQSAKLVGENLGVQANVSVQGQNAPVKPTVPTGQDSQTLSPGQQNLVQNQNQQSIAQNQKIEQVLANPINKPASESEVLQTPVTKVTSVESSAATVEDPLAIDPEKINSEVSAALKKARPQSGLISSEVKPPSTVEARPLSGQVVVADSLRSETKAAELKSVDGLGNLQGQKDISSVDAKLGSAVRANQEGIESKATMQRQSSVDASTATTASNKDLSANRSAESQSAQTQSLAGARGIRASSVQAANASRGQAKPITMNGVNGTTTTSVAGGLNSTLGTNGTLSETANAQSQGQNAGKDGDTKQEFSASLKSAIGGSKGTEKSGSDSSQAFSLNETNAATSTRRSEAAAKAQGTSYASKSTEEVKDIYAALSKGVDRMLSTKTDSINVKINFDQGGSISMKLSVENGQVNTFMDTDLAGLEEVIKSSWGDLSSEWNQKGLKLNAPQFSQNASQGRDNSLASFDQKGQQQSQEFGEASDSHESNQRNSGGNSQSRRGIGNSQSSGVVEEGVLTPEVPDSDDGDAELQTYA